jgi:TonB family protein
MAGQKKINHSQHFFEDYLPAPQDNEKLFSLILFCSLACFVCVGLYFKTIKPALLQFDEKKIEMIRTQFLLQEKKKPIKRIEPVKPKEEELVKPKALDLTKPVELNQKQNDIVETPAELKTAARRIYGLRNVYSVGIGAAASGSAAEAVIGKLGNTINANIDTLTATEKDLKGKLVSVTTVTKMPEPREIVKPEYTEEMKNNKIEGTISLKILVDIDGSVKEAIALNDLGYGSKESALKAIKKMRFSPALEGEKAVAVWIVLKIKFVLQDE